MKRLKARIHRRRDDLRALRELLRAADRMRDNWAETNDAGRTDLWRDLHRNADDVGDRYGGRIGRMNRRGYRQWWRSLPRAERRMLRAEES